MLKMRLERVGRKHEPSFRLVLTDSKNSTKSGRSEEVLGSYDPRKSTDAFNTERIKHWLSQGISLSPTVHNLLIKNRIITGKKIDVSAVSKKAPAVAEAMADKPVEVAAAPVAAAATAPAPVAEETPAPEAAPEPEVVAEAPAAEPEVVAAPEEAPVVAEAPAPEEAPAEVPAAEERAPAPEEIPAEVAVAPEETKAEEAPEPAADTETPPVV